MKVSINQQINQVVINERLKCANDHTYMIRKHFKIEHPKRGKIPFNLYPFQDETLKIFERERYVIVAKARQLGISTLTAAHSVANMLQNESYKILVIATTKKVAQNIIKKVKIMWDGVPDWLRNGVTEVFNNMQTFSLSNGSEIQAVASSPNAARSEALSLLIIDEAAFIKDFEEIWTAAQATLATGGSCIILSTPNGAGGLFFRLWNQAVEHEQLKISSDEDDELAINLYPVKLKWDVHPERDQAWRDNQTVLLGSQAAAQEHDVSFTASGHTVIEPEDLTWYFENTVRDPIEKRGPNQEYWLWAYPQPGKSYLVTADVARGDGADYSAAQIIDLETFEQVAEWKGRVDTRIFGKVLDQIAREWNFALLAVENANIGWDTLQELIDLSYPNLYYTYRQDPYVDASIHLSKAQDLKDREDMIPGHTTSPRTRPLQIAKLQTATRTISRYLIYHSERFHSELTTFKWINGKAQAQSGYNDDLIMAMSIALYVVETALKLKETGLQLTKLAVNKIQKITPVIKKQDPQRQMRFGKQNINLNWLF